MQLTETLCRNGLRDGVGTFFYASGAVYHGQWKQNLKEGSGKYIFENGTPYEGEFIANKVSESEAANWHSLNLSTFTSDARCAFLP